MTASLGRRNLGDARFPDSGNLHQGHGIGKVFPILVSSPAARTREKLSPRKRRWTKMNPLRHGATTGKPGTFSGRGINPLPEARDGARGGHGLRVDIPDERTPPPAETSIPGSSLKGVIRSYSETIRRSLRPRPAPV